MIDEASYIDLLKGIKVEFPDFELLPKRSSKLMKVVALLLRVATLGTCGNIFTLFFTTTIGYKVYTPACWGVLSPLRRYAIMSHERVHMRQRRKYGALLFSVTYLLLPLPVVFAYFRAKFEKEAYETTIRVYAKYHPRALPGMRAEVISCFTDGSYLWMWPFRSSIGKWFDETVRAALEEAGRS